MSNFISIIGILISAIITQLLLVFEEKSKIIKAIMPFSTGIITYKCIANVKPAVLIVLEKLLSEQLFYVRMN